MMMKKEPINIKDCLVPIELRKIRETKLITMKEVSEDTGLSTTVISNIEHNRNVSLKSLVAYADYFGYEITITKKKPEVIIDI